MSDRLVDLEKKKVEISQSVSSSFILTVKVKLCLTESIKQHVFFKAAYEEDVYKWKEKF